jgi:hypothetical protein
MEQANAQALRPDASDSRLPPNAAVDPGLDKHLSPEVGLMAAPNPVERWKLASLRRADEATAHHRQAEGDMFNFKDVSALRSLLTDIHQAKQGRAGRDLLSEVLQRDLQFTAEQARR